MKKKRRSGWVSTLLVVLVFLGGAAAALYPTASEHINSYRQTRAIRDYTAAVSQLSEADHSAMFAAADAYNRRIWERSNPYLLSEAEAAEYDRLLDLSGTGVMGYVRIDAIDCRLPICHGSDDAVLQTAIGHVEWTSLPVGGAGTHTVLSGHRGLPSAKLFSELDRLRVGDVFTLSVLDEELTYEVDQILVVLPEESYPLLPAQGEDYCTLVTCTPYGINTHRLLVRGRRIDSPEAGDLPAVRVVAEAAQVSPVLAGALAAVPLVLLMLLWPALDRKKNGHKGIE